MNFLIASTAALFVSTGVANAQGLLIPLIQDRSVQSEASAGPLGTPLSSTSDSEAAVGFAPFNGNVSSPIGWLGAQASAGATQVSEILPDGITASGTMFCEGSGNGPEELNVSASSDVLVRFRVDAPCSYAFTGFIEGFDAGFGSAWLYDPAGAPLSGDFGVAEGRFDINGSGVLMPGTYSVELACFGDGGVFDTGGTIGYASAAFDMSLVLTPLSGNYCASAPNSTGASSSIGFSGSQSLSSNDFALETLGSPPSTFGMYFYGETQAQTPLGNGTLCLANPFLRIGVPIVTGGAGAASLTIDMTSPPFSSGPGAIQAGSTWNFQWAHRDTVGAGFNYSDGLWVIFLP